MWDSALICKFIGLWLNKKALVSWINTKWRLKGHYTLQLGSKGFFIVIFDNLEDWEKIFDGGPYFFNSTRLFLKP